MYDIAAKKIDNIRDELTEVSRSIWSRPEGAHEEYFACEASASLLEKHGFSVERHYLGIPTAFRASFGQSSPVIGFLGEYDALPGLSQEAVPHRKPIPEINYGHGCGHNLLGVCAIAAAIGVKEAMEASGSGGTLVVYGCPAEETCAMKGVMASKGAFYELDAAFAWHPGVYNRASYNSCTGTNSTIFHFKGKTAHAANDPENGRSALDAAELMNVGANYLREHIPTDVRMHYIIKDGGLAPNIVPDHASVWYYDRSHDINIMKDVEARLLNIARGAALMTGTTVEIESLGGCYPTLPNWGLSSLIDRCMRKVELEPWTQDEIGFAAQINSVNPEIWKKNLNFAGIKDKIQLCDTVLDIDLSPEYGSTDVGDVSYIVPTIFYKTACFAIGAPGHSWQATACAGTSIGTKGMIYGAKVTALAAISVLTDEDLLKSIRSEFEERIKGIEYKPMLSHPATPV